MQKERIAMKMLRFPAFRPGWLFPRCNRMNARKGEKVLLRWQTAEGTRRSPKGKSRQEADETDDPGLEGETLARDHCCNAVPPSLYRNGGYGILPRPLPKGLRNLTLVYRR